MLRAALLAVLLASQAQAGCETILATDSSKVAKAGDTMTGPLVFSGPNSYVTAVSSINAQGIWGTFTGNLTGNVTGNCSGNAGTATALAANGANCAAGNAPLGVDASGAVEGCYDVATQAELDTHTSATDAHSATSANTASRIVLRDGSGNFSAGTITAALTGNAQTATALAANGTNCSAGSYPLGVDASGNVESCTSASSGTGKLKQAVVCEDTATTLTAAAQIPYDDTIPQNTEGVEWLTCSITPTDGTNNLDVEVSVWVGENTNVHNIQMAALFRDTSANAIGVGTYVVAGNTGVDSGMPFAPIRIFKRVAASSTAATTFKVRVGGDIAGQPVRINGNNGGRKFGGAINSYIKVSEVAP